MNKKDYKKKVSEFFSLKSPKSRSSKRDDSSNSSQQQLTPNTLDQPEQYSNLLSTSNNYDETAPSTSTSIEPRETASRSSNTSMINTTLNSSRVKAVAEDMASKKRDVIIIGAGLSETTVLVEAGRTIHAQELLTQSNHSFSNCHEFLCLSAAKELLAYKLDVLVLEARDRVGGRTFTKQTGIGESKLWVDLGGSYVGPTQNHILNLIEELKLETYLVEDSMDAGYLRANRISTNRSQCATIAQNNIERAARFNPASGYLPLGGIFHWLDYIHMVRLIDSYGAEIPNDAPWNAPRAREWDAKTWKQFVDENSWTKRVRGYFNNVYVVIDVCVDPNEVSMLWFLWYVKQCGGYGRSISTTNGGQERKVKGGTQQISEALQKLVGRQRVLLNKPVCSVDQTKGPFVIVTTIDGMQFKADYLIYAISPHLWLKIHHNPALPAAKNLLAERSPMGHVAKIILYYDKPFWHESNFSGCFMIDSPDRKAQPIILSLDETKPDGSFPAIIGFIAGPACYETCDMSDAEVARYVARCYADTTKLEEFMSYKRVERFDWTHEQYSGGCYTSINTPNTLTKFGPYLREPFGRIYYAGTETAIQWSGYMDGAISAGKRAARQVLHVTGNLEEDEIWRDEPDSVTVPPKPFIYPSSYNYAPSISSLVKFSHILLALGLVSFVLFKHNRLV